MTLSEREFNRMHEVLRQILVDFDQTCRELGVSYWADAGTLLGAVRHGSFIPWDDDVDVCMSRGDLARFRDGVATTPLAKRYVVVGPSDDPAIGVDLKIYHRSSHATALYTDLHRLTPPVQDGLYLDIVIMDPVSPWRLVRYFDRVLGWLTMVRPWATTMASSPAVSGRTRLRWRLAATVPNPVVRAMAWHLGRRATRRPSQLFGVGKGGLYSRRPYPRDVLFPLTSVNFDGFEIPAPNNPKRYLEIQYGPTFMAPPTPDARVTHTGSIAFDED